MESHARHVIGADDSGWSMDTHRYHQLDFCGHARSSASRLRTVSHTPVASSVSPNRTHTWSADGLTSRIDVAGAAIN
ncbi:hypothetical protein [Ktedonobacter robiniae]|uniref:Uncharacterized protein n=1 Tax=Ktedonobacter robiniae TaxID=2778365 RepID=A0ABQ3V113_9CHLR|nr:hypothetical protein [Ktedonobacter robiniae]GHO58663.1 hypothetical protein KSB_71380 [Ktedonobacter robiniae]